MVLGGITTAQFATNQMAGLELFIFILGDSPASEHTFSVMIEGSDSVSQLKEQVHAKAQGRFSPGVSAIDLILWKVLSLCSFRFVMF
jgi:hypothetical protein